MKGLTLTRPWSYAFRSLDKRIENRGWAPGAGELAKGDWVALHSGKAFDHEALEHLLQLEDSGQLQATEYDAETGLARAAMMSVRGIDYPAGVIDGVARYAGVREGPVPGWQARWRMASRYAWLFDDYVPLLRPVPCRGRQRLWNVPAEVLEAVRREIERSRALLGLDRPRSQPVGFSRTRVANEPKRRRPA